MEIKEVSRLLGVIEEKKWGVVRDGMKARMFRLVLFMDGSGEIQADWSQYREDMCHAEKVLHEIFSVDGPIFEFSNTGELEAWLKEQSGV
jgi:hypothetical protein